MKISETLDKAADHIVEHGWHQGFYWPTVGHALGEPEYVEGDPCCALGALSVVEGVNVYAGLTMAMGFLGQHLGMNAMSIADWNDTPERTKDEVLAALRGAAKRAEVLGK